MWWALLIIVVIIGAFAVPKFGKAILGIVAVLIAIGFIVYFSEQAEEEASKKRIAPTEIELADLVLVPGYGSGYTLRGRVKNTSPTYSANGITLKVVMRDCRESPENEKLAGPGEKYQKYCDVVGEDDVYIWGEIPPGQTRGLEEMVSFSGLPAFRGKSEWSYSITEISGK